MSQKLGTILGTIFRTVLNRGPDLWNRDPDPPKESDLSEDPDPFGIQFLIPNQFPVENKIFLAKNNGKMPWDETKCVIMKDCFQNLATNTQKRSGSSVGSGSFSGSGSLTKRSGSHLVDSKRAKRSGSRESESFQHYSAVPFSSRSCRLVTPSHPHSGRGGVAFICQVRHLFLSTFQATEWSLPRAFHFFEVLWENEIDWCSWVMVK